MDATGAAAVAGARRHGARPIEVTWEIASDQAMQQLVRSGKTTAWPELAHSVHVEVGALEPARLFLSSKRATGSHERLNAKE